MHAPIVLPHCSQCADLEARIARLRWNSELAMLNRAGLEDAIERLPGVLYTVVMCDIDRLKALNAATGNHFQANRYLRGGLAVRAGELAAQLLGDEIVFILEAGADAERFVRRIAHQLRAQPLTQEERRALILAGGDGRLSATFAYREGVGRANIWPAIEQCSVEVLAKKARRP